MCDDSCSNSNENTNYQIASCRATLSDSEEAAPLVDFTLESKKALKGVIKDGKKDGYIFNRGELA
jgi:hypothetical protein